MGCGKYGAPGSCAMGPCGTPPPPRGGKAETGEGNVPSRLTLETARLTSAHKPHTTAESRGLARLQWMSREDSSHFHRMLSVQRFFLKCHSLCCNCGADSGPKRMMEQHHGLKSEEPAHVSLSLGGVSPCCFSSQARPARRFYTV